MCLISKWRECRPICWYTAGCVKRLRYVVFERCNGFRKGEVKAAVLLKQMSSHVTKKRIWALKERWAEPILAKATAQGTLPLDDFLQQDAHALGISLVDVGSMSTAVGSALLGAGAAAAGGSARVRADGAAPDASSSGKDTLGRRALEVVKVWLSEKYKFLSF